MTPDWRARIRAHAREARLDLPAETVDELATHLEDAYAAARRRGASHAEANSASQRLLDTAGLTELRRHTTRAAAQPAVLNANDAAGISRSRSFAMAYALRMAVRQFRQHRAFALITVLVLGLGTGAAASIYTIVDAVVLKPLPYRAPAELVTMWDANPAKGLAHERVSPVNFMDYSALPAFADAAAWWRPDLDLVDPGLDPVRTKGVEVSGNLFSLLGVRPALGAGFPDDGPWYSRDRIAVISDRLWRSRYSADPSLVGRQLRFTGVPYTIVGIMPAGFNYPGDVDIWERLQWDMTQHSRNAHFMEAVARLKPGAEIAQAQTQVDALSQRLAAQFPASNSHWGVRVVPLLDDQLGFYRPALIILFGAVGLLLVIGCLNVASLLLTRALSREREVAVRTALGASPRQLIAQLLAEGFILSLAGAAVGLVAAVLSIPLVVRLTPVNIPRLSETTVNLRVLVFSLGVVATTTVVFGLVPALVLLKRRLVSDLRSGERGSSRSARRLYQALVAGEVALAGALLISSVLLVRTVQHMTRVSTGVEAASVLTTSVQLPGARYPQWPQVADVHAALVADLRQQPGIDAAGAGVFLPVDPAWRLAFSIDGDPPPARPEDAPQAQHSSVTQGYFEALGARLVAGRSLASTDSRTSPPVVVVNETFARQFLPGRNAVGVRLHSTARNIGPLGTNLLNGQSFEIVGIIADVRNTAIAQPIEPAIYFSAQQFPFRSMYLAVRGRDTATVLAGIRAALQTAAPNIPLGDVQTWDDRFASLSAEPRLLMTTLVAFGSLAALLAAIGVYGLFSWSVAIRGRELAIRLSLGARPAGIGGIILRQSALLVVTGLITGWAIVRLADGLLTKVLFKVSSTDAASAATACGVLLLAALISCIAPAVRAARTDPVEALKGE